MRIPPDTIRSLVNLYANRADRTGHGAAAQNAANSQGAARSDRTDFSDTVKILRELREHVKELPEVDEAKVNRIKQQLADGTFQVNPRAVAGRILEELGGADS